MPGPTNPHKLENAEECQKFVFCAVCFRHSLIPLERHYFPLLLACEHMRGHMRKYDGHRARAARLCALALWCLMLCGVPSAGGDGSLDPAGPADVRDQPARRLVLGTQKVRRQRDCARQTPAPSGRCTRERMKKREP